MAIVIGILSLITLCSAQNTFLWPTRGGSNKNQQRTPDGTSIYIDSQNIDEIELQCKYISEGGFTMYGFPAIYKNEESGAVNAVFCDFSGFITNINLDDCSVNWRVYIA